MKICGIVAEYNPFHNGHLRQIDYVKNVLGAEKIIVLMSGNFTQRGEPAIMNKFLRAKHAIIAGADMVIELPTVFATANAEIFANGAMNVLNSVGIIDGICFGAESTEKQEFIDLAVATNNESKEFKKALKDNLDSGISFAKAKFMAVKAINGDNGFNEDLVSMPNNILGLEYTKALLKLKSSIEIFPMERTGNHNDMTLKKGISSATSIRNAVKIGKKRKAVKSMPKFVYKDIKQYPYIFDKLAMSKILTADSQEMAKISDCTEGLENRIKALSKDNKTLSSLIEKVSTKRYTATRIQRIITANLLDIKKSFIEECLSAPLYAKVLAINSESKELLSLLKEKSAIPVITRKSDVLSLKKTSLDCFNKDVLANDMYNLIASENNNENQMIMI